MQNLNRRSFLHRCSVVATTAAIAPRWLEAEQLLLDDTNLRAMTSAAIDAAKAAGATYVDVHYRVSRNEYVGLFEGVRIPRVELSANVGLSVRSLVRGYWGFASMNGVATMADAVRLGRDAAAQASIAAKGKARTVELAPIAIAASGHWSPPGVIDPFTVSFEEKVDFFAGMIDLMQWRRYNVAVVGGISCTREDRTFASSDGAFATQTLYQSGGVMGLGVEKDWQTEESGWRTIDFLTPAGAGWEYVRSAPYRENVDRIIHDALRSRRPTPVDVGRYDVVFDTKAMAGILTATIGTGTELDRAMGYQANDRGTSYITDPAAMLGNYKMGAPLLTVTSNRSMPGGAATVKWDEEGIEPANANLVTKGILTDMQTTREAASWIGSYYKTAGKAVRSNGCAGMDQSTSPVMQVNPNFVMSPGREELSFEELVKDTKKGFAVVDGVADTDQQALNGTIRGTLVYEIVNGTLGRPVRSAQCLYRTPNFWQGLVAIGGPRSARWFGFEGNSNLGISRTVSAHTVAAVPAKITGVAMVDALRKA